MTLTADDPRHGAPGTYRDRGCRCQPCRDAVALQENRYQLRRAANGGQLRIDKTGAVRRIQALMALGWPRRTLSAYLGCYTSDILSGILNGRRTWINPPTHTHIAQMYDQLCMTPGPSTSSRTRAAAKGWAPPLAWNNIDADSAPVRTVDAHDESTCDEVYVQRVIDGWPRTRKLTNAEAVEAVRRLRARGVGERQIGKRFGLKPERYPRPIGQGAAS